MLAALLLNPHPTGRQLGRRRVKRYCWDLQDPTKEEVRKLYETARREVPKHAQGGILAQGDWQTLPPVAQIDLTRLIEQRDVLMALASSIDVEMAKRERRKADEEMILVSLFFKCD